MVMAINLGFNVPILIASALMIVAGVRSLKFRGLNLTRVALFSSLLSALTCYCFPSGLGVMIFGMFLVFRDDVREAYAMGARGRDSKEIRAHFAGIGTGAWRTFE